MYKHPYETIITVELYESFNPMHANLLLHFDLTDLRFKYQELSGKIKQIHFLQQHYQF